MVQGIHQILTSPRYTGRQVCGRHRKLEVLIDPGDVLLSNTVKMRRTPPSAWTWSSHDAHPAIISPDTFRQAQERRLRNTPQQAALA